MNSFSRTTKAAVMRLTRCPDKRKNLESSFQTRRIDSYTPIDQHRRRARVPASEQENEYIWSLRSISIAREYDTLVSLACSDNVWGKST